MNTEVIESPVLSDSYVITKEFSTAEQFSMFIEEEALKSGESLIDIIIAYCDEHDIDVDVTAKLITKSLKEKLAVEFEDRNMIRNDHGTLDV